MVGRDLVLIASQGGVNFHLGNNPQADGASAIFPGLGDDWDEVSFAERDVGKNLKPSEVSRYYYKKGVQFLKERPGSFLKLLAKKAYLFVNGYEISNNQYIYQFGEYSPLLSLLLFSLGEGRGFRFAFPFGIVSPLAILGLWFTRKNEKASLLRLFLFSYAAAVIGFFVCSRYRTPLYPFFILFASSALLWLLTRFAQGEPRFLLAALPAFLALFWLTNSNLYEQDFRNPAQHHFNLGTARLKRGDYAGAVREYENVLDMDLSYPRTHLNLGVAYHRQGLLGKAKEEYEKELRFWPEEARALNNLAVAYRGEGQSDEAINYGRRAIEIRPHYGEAHLNLGVAYELTGDLQAAEDAYEKALEIDPSLAEAQNRLGVIELRRGEPDSAVLRCEKAVKLEPLEPSYRYNLGLAYAACSSYEKAVGEFEEALRIDPGLFAAYHNLGMAYFHLGRLSMASRSLEKALRINPGSRESRYVLELIREEARGNEESKERR